MQRQKSYTRIRRWRLALGGAVCACASLTLISLMSLHASLSGSTCLLTRVACLVSLDSCLVKHMHNTDSSGTRQISGKLRGVAAVRELTCFVCLGENPKELRLSQTPKDVSSISTSATDPKKEKSTPVESV